MNNNDLRPAGYGALIERYGLEVIPNWHKSFVGAGRTHRVVSTGAVTEEIFPAPHWPGDSLGGQLEFALKYDGTNLGILAALFQVIDTKELMGYIQSKPTGKYARRVWFLYELLTGQNLPLDDLTQGNYIDLLEPHDYYTVSRARRVRRQRINDNLLGGRQFCPTIRRTEILRHFEAIGLPKRCEQVISSYSPELLRRALSYLYTKETKSSFEIEHIKPSSLRTERFVALLQLAERDDFCEESHLVDLQNRIVDPRFRDSSYRTVQNYVGQTVAQQRELVHFVSPKPEDLDNLMSGLIAAHHRMEEGGVSVVAQAAAIAYGFVFLHPFEDGNGRIHRFLIHNILARRRFTPEGVMFPVSAAMLENPAAYNDSLEAFSRPLMTLVDYFLDDEGRMSVHNNTAAWYRYVDMTPQTEALFSFIEQTINTVLVEELVFLANYDESKQSIQEIVDMPDRQIDLFVRFCLQNNGRLSKRKRTSHFDLLSDDEITQMEIAVQSAYGLVDSAD